MCVCVCVSLAVCRGAVVHVGVQSQTEEHGRRATTTEDGQASKRRLATSSHLDVLLAKSHRSDGTIMDTPTRRPSCVTPQSHHPTPSPLPLPAFHPNSCALRMSWVKERWSAGNGSGSWWNNNIYFLSFLRLPPHCLPSQDLSVVNLGSYFLPFEGLGLVWHKYMTS